MQNQFAQNLICMMQRIFFPWHCSFLKESFDSHNESSHLLFKINYSECLSESYRHIQDRSSYQSIKYNESANLRIVFFFLFWMTKICDFLLLATTWKLERFSTVLRLVNTSFDMLHNIKENVNNNKYYRE